MNEDGVIAGVSRPLSGADEGFGLDAWIWVNGQTLRLGLLGPSHVGTTGYRWTEVRFLAENGHAAGESTRYVDINTHNGFSAWVWDGSTTRRIGEFGPEHTSASGEQRSGIAALSATGQAAGFSVRYAGAATPQGMDAWVWRNGVQTSLGLSGPVYVGLNGYRHSEPVLQSDDGLVIGRTRRQPASVGGLGWDAWAWNGVQLEQIGLSGGEYTLPDGTQECEPVLMTQTGQVAGWSRLNLATSSGESPRDTWVWRPGTGGAVRVNLTGAEHTSSLTGARSSRPVYQLESGLVAGYSAVYANGITGNDEYDCWAWSPSTGESTRVNLAGPAYTWTTGKRIGQLRLAHEAGFLAGTSRRPTLQFDAWWSNGAESVRASPIEAPLPGVGAYTSATPVALNSAGHLIGYSFRPATGGSAADAWYFDAGTRETTVIVGSVRTADAYTKSTPVLIAADGVLLGHYLYFEAGAGPGTSRAFAFRPDRGFTDLGELTVGGLPASGWSEFTEPKFGVDMSHVYGHGRVSGQAEGQSAFVLAQGEGSCYANCDRSTVPPVINIADFTCFLAEFTSETAYANCDGSLTPPVLNVRDFMCFLNAFATGCP